MAKLIFFMALFMAVVVLLLAIIRRNVKNYINDSIKNSTFEIKNKNKPSKYFVDIEMKEKD
jgi:Na+-translocating ferredoxin:NAD+ oxidoreductase RnfG subunit